MYLEEDVTVGDFVNLKSPNLQGIVRFIGEIYTTPDPVYGFVYYGVELCGPFGDNDGTFNDQFCFQTKPNHAVFVRRPDITRILNLNYDVPRLTIDDVIYLKSFKDRARVRWIGKLNNNDLVYFGLELKNPIFNREKPFSCDRLFITSDDNCAILLSSADLYNFKKTRK